MELVRAIFRYFNRVICSDDLLKELNKYKISSSSDEIKKVMAKLILEIEHIQKTVPNEMDEIEIERKKILNFSLNSINKNSSSKKEYNELLEELNQKRDSGELHVQIVKLIKNNMLIQVLINTLEDKEIVDIITEPFFCFLPLKISSIKFKDLINLMIKEHNKEALLKIAFDYGDKHDISKVWDYFIENRDVHYLIRLLVSVKFDVYFKKIYNKVNSTNDYEFIKDFNKEIKKRVKFVVYEG